MAGLFQFGYAVRASAGSSKVPGAFSLTWIDARSEQEAEEIKLTAAVLAVELAQEPGFLSWVGMEIGSRMYTITAWENEGAVRAVMRNSTHLAAVKRYLTEDFGAAASTGVWSPQHLNAVRVRCLSCAGLTDRAQPAALVRAASRCRRCRTTGDGPDTARVARRSGEGAADRKHSCTNAPDDQEEERE